MEEPTLTCETCCFLRMRIEGNMITSYYCVIFADVSLNQKACRVYIEADEIWHRSCKEE